MAKETIFWDFEGTLVVRSGLWRSALMEVLDENEPGHSIRPEQIQPYLREGFPWHTPEEPHLQFTNASSWWEHLNGLFERAFQGVGFNPGRAQELAECVRGCFINPDRYITYGDSVPTLVHLSETGWKHVIFSNHVPELEEIVAALDIAPFIDSCTCSACTGYEKPHPESFSIALSDAGHPGKSWMVGDNYLADIEGAEQAGIPAIQVRTPNSHNCRYYARDLLEAASIIDSTPLH